MIRKSTIAAFAIMAVVGAASPAFALDAHSPALNGGGSTGYNSTNVLTGTANDYGLNNGTSGLHAFAMVPRAHVRSGLRAFDMVLGAASGSDTPSATGGGSTGYNSYVGRDS
jgi:gamma-glutamyl:cysteine ligase YbdK (ATP-grasp superfamily)